MNWESRYLLPDPLGWQGRADSTSATDLCFHHRTSLVNLLTQRPDKATAQQPAFAFIGFKCDEGVQRDLGRTGAVEGPMAIRPYLVNLPLKNPNLRLYDVGDIICTDHDMEASQLALAEVVTLLLNDNIRPIIIGGSHEAAYGEYLGIANYLPANKQLGIINFDAHFDMHAVAPNLRASATTAFHQIALAHQRENRRLDYHCIGIQSAGNSAQAFEVAKQFNTHILMADALHQGQQESCQAFTEQLIRTNDALYMSLSLDVFSPAFAPGVSSIQPLGLSPWHLLPLIRQIANSGKVLCYDIVEHVPRYDIDHRTAKLAATLIYEIIHHHREPLLAS